MNEDNEQQLRKRALRFFEESNIDLHERNRSSYLTQRERLYAYKSPMSGPRWSASGGAWDGGAGLVEAAIRAQTVEQVAEQVRTLTKTELNQANPFIDTGEGILIRIYYSRYDGLDRLSPMHMVTYPGSFTANFAGCECCGYTRPPVNVNVVPSLEVIVTFMELIEPVIEKHWNFGRSIRTNRPTNED